MNREDARLEALDLISILIEEELDTVLTPDWSNNHTKAQEVFVRAEMLWIAEAIKKAVREKQATQAIPF